VDLVAVVVAADHVSRAGVEPIVELARASGAVPLLVLTRCEQVPDLPGLLAQCPAVATCARTGRGLEELLERIDRHLTMAFVGARDAGSSDLVRALVGELAVRRAAKRQLYPLPAGGAVIDMPGLRAVA
jgi:ribosome biogenesis GTPase